MARFGSIGTQYFDNVGDPLSSGYLYFYEQGTTTDKTTYSDLAQTIANTQPVRLTAAGRQPDIFFTGLAKAVLQDGSHAQISETDPVGTAFVDDAFSEWSATVGYGLNDIVTASDGFYYLSIISPNLNKDPTALVGAASWMKIQFLNIYNTSYGYNIGDVVLYSSRTWISLTAANLNNQPDTSAVNWRPMRSDLWPESTPVVANFTADVGRGYLCDTSGGVFTMTLPASPVKGDQIGFVDYGSSFATFNMTMGRGGNKIMNLEQDLICDIDLFSSTLQFTTDKGWILV
jgi:hypothetical protein